MASISSRSSRSSRSSHLSDQSKTYTFHGTSRTLVKWNPHSRDRDLWLDDGDCLVQLAPTAIPNQSAQYALKIPLAELRASQNSELLRRCHTSTADGVGRLHVPPPTTYIEHVLPYDLTTRNYFAFLHNKPLVSTCLGPAMIELWDRIQHWHSKSTDISDKLLAYFRGQGYLHAANNPFAACASLALADHAQQKSIWLNSFAHCVGLCSRLDVNNPEYSTLSNTTKALITRAALGVETRITSFTSAVGSFLEDDFSTENLGLTKPARDHLDRFRSFLQSFFVEKLEYFPPSITVDEFDMASWDEVRADLQSLYDYLADTGSSKDILSDRGVTGGVCVNQNVQAFDIRHSFEPLSHPLPLLPSLTPVRRTTESQVSLRNLKLIRMESDFRPTSQESLTKASNSDDAELLARPVVQEYINFEQQKLQEKLSLAEARKVRWLLIYGCIQMLNCILVQPPGVEHIEECAYPLCVNLGACPISATSETPLMPTPEVHKTQLTLAIPQKPADDDTDRISIHPDCEAESAHDFLTLSRKGSGLDTTFYDTDNSRQTNSATASPITRTASIRSSVQSSMTALSKSVVGGLSRRNSFRKSTQHVPRRIPSTCDIVDESAEVEATEDLVPATPVDLDLADFDFGVEMPQRKQNAVIDDDTIRAQRRSSAHAPYASDYELDEPQSPSSDISRRSSAASSSDCETPVTEPSSRSNSTRENKPLPGLARLDEDCVLNIDSIDEPAILLPSSSAVSLNAGVYTPSGLITYDVPISRFSAASPRRNVYERRGQAAMPVFTAAKRPHVVDRHITTASAHVGHQQRNRVSVGRYTYSDMP